MSKHFDRVNNRTRAIQVSNYSDNRPTVYRMEEQMPMDNGGGDAQGYDSLLGYWHILVRNKVTLLCFALAGLAVAILFRLVQTPVYRARTSMEIQDFNSDFMGSKDVDPTQPNQNSSTDSYFQTQIKILQSDSLLERVVNKMNTEEERPESGWGAFSAKIQHMLGLGDHSGDTNKDAFMAKARSNLSVRASGMTRLVEVMYDSEDPKFAAQFANTLVSEFVEQSQEMRWKASQRTGEGLEAHLNEMKANLEKSEANLQAYARSSGLTMTEKENVTEGRLKELQDELDKAQADRVDKQAKFEEAKSKPAESLPETIDDPMLREYSMKVAELRRQLVELSATLTPEHYKVQRVQAQINQMQSDMERQRTNVLRRVGNEFASATRREKLLQQSFIEQQKTVANQSDKAIHYDTLRREVDSSRQLYDTLLNRVKQAQLLSAMRASNVLVVDEAKPPFLPAKPNVPVNSAVGLFCGIFLGLGFVIFRTRFDRSIQAPGDLQAFLNLPELGVIPMAGVCDTPAVKNAKALAPADPNDCLELVTWKHKPSAVAESFRAMLTSILLPGQ